MSLINEALKKAQKQRTGDTPSLTAMPAIGGESAARIARRGKPEGFNALLLKIGLGVGALAVVIVGAVLILRRPAAAPAPATTFTPLPAAPAIVPANTKPVVEAPVIAAPVAAPVTAPTPPLVATPNSPPVHATPTAPTTVVLAPVEAPKPVETAAIQLAPAPAQPVVPAALRKLEPRAINFVNSIRVAGIRASANDSKVLMNDRVYRVGSVVEAEMGLTLVGITANSLTFEDENGGRFTRTF